MLTAPNSRLKQGTLLCQACASSVHAKCRGGHCHPPTASRLCIPHVCTKEYHGPGCLPSCCDIVNGLITSKALAFCIMISQLQPHPCGNDMRTPEDPQTGCTCTAATLVLAEPCILNITNLVACQTVSLCTCISCSGMPAPQPQWLTDCKPQEGWRVPVH